MDDRLRAGPERDGEIALRDEVSLSAYLIHPGWSCRGGGERRTGFSAGFSGSVGFAGGGLVLRVFDEFGREKRTGVAEPGFGGLGGAR